ncbi:hypothetical protein CLU79DRAFT_729112, partial [Phycomyces nitens]
MAMSRPARMMSCSTALQNKPLILAVYPPIQSIIYSFTYSFVQDSLSLSLSLSLCITIYSIFIKSI